VRGQSHDQANTNGAECMVLTPPPVDQGQGYQESFGDVSLFINGQAGLWFLAYGEARWRLA
jgi:hypothetical protein